MPAPPALAFRVTPAGLLEWCGGPGATADADLRVSVDAQLKRLGRDRTRPLLQSGDREQVLRNLSEHREPLYAEVADLMLDTDGLSPGSATSTLAHLLATQWQRTEQPA